ncbi:MAG: hypothetical protein ACK4E7_05290 [Permianibacter sp.]
MGALNLALHIYACCVVAIALRLGLHVTRKLDAHDWHFAKLEILCPLLGLPLLWPAWVFFPKHCLRVLKNPALAFEQGPAAAGNGFHAAYRQRILQRLEANPPPCGKWVAFHCPANDGDGYSCTITMPADVLEAALWRMLEERHHHPDAASQLHDENWPLLAAAVTARDADAIAGSKGAILRWLNTRDTADETFTAIPEPWASFDDIEVIADELARSGIAIVDCRQCQRRLAPSQVIARDDQGRPGWNFTYTYCDAGHLLMSRWSFHVYVRQPPRPASVGKSVAFS